jgi:xanthine dehydrogenase molybdopterin-binding subunit B
VLIGNSSHGTAAAEIKAESAGTYQLRRLGIVCDVGDSLSLLIGLGHIEWGLVPADGGPGT